MLTETGKKYVYKILWRAEGYENFWREKFFFHEDMAKDFAMAIKDAGAVFFGKDFVKNIKVTITAVEIE